MPLNRNGFDPVGTARSKGGQLPTVIVVGVLDNIGKLDDTGGVAGNPAVDFFGCSTDQQFTTVVCCPRPLFNCFGSLEDFHDII